MTKTQTKPASSLKPLTKVAAPVVYINDCSDIVGNGIGKHVTELGDLIPSRWLTTFDGWRSMSRAKRSAYTDKVVLVSDSILGDRDASKVSRAHIVRDLTPAGRYVSINIVHKMADSPADKEFGGHHLTILHGEDTARKIYQWLFSVFSVREMLLLVTDQEMSKPDLVNWPTHKYSALIDVQKARMQGDVQFVALVTSKAEVSNEATGKVLRWEVIDKSATAKFFFPHKGPDSQRTWDWVLGFKPGDKVALGSAKLVQVKPVKGKMAIRLMKAPLRATSSLAHGTAVVLQHTANFFESSSRKISSPRPTSKWVSRTDLNKEGKPIDWKKVNEAHDEAVRNGNGHYMQVFNEKGTFTWSDDASVASTHVGTDPEEKTKEFC